MKTPEDLAESICSTWYLDDFGPCLLPVDRRRLVGRIAAAIAAERARMDSTLEVWKHKVALLTDERNRLRADLTAVCETLDMVLAASPTPPVGPVLDRITKYRAWRDDALLTDERNRIHYGLTEALQQIIDLDQVQRTEVVSVDASGATHRVTWVDGRCARIARALLDRLGMPPAEPRKRPVAFRWQTPSGCWVYNGDEAVAAEMSGGDYQGLYVRDGTPPAVCPD